MCPCLDFKVILLTQPYKKKPTTTSLPLHFLPKSSDVYTPQEWFTAVEREAYKSSNRGEANRTTNTTQSWGCHLHCFGVGNTSLQKPEAHPLPHSCKGCGLHQAVSSLWVQGTERSGSRGPEGSLCHHTPRARETRVLFRGPHSLPHPFEEYMQEL